MVEKNITKSAKQTQKLAERFAKEILASSLGKAATVLSLQGDLGAGKTTFLQGFAKGLGIKEKILSPTFILMKRFKITKFKITKFKMQKSKIKMTNQNSKFTNFYHIDCYRLNKPEEILHLGFREIILNPQNIVAIEWPEKIGKILPKNIVSIKFEHLEENKREITIDKF